MCALFLFFLLPALLGFPVGFSGDFSYIEDTIAPGVLLPLPDVVQNDLQPVWSSWILSACSVNPVKASILYSRSLETNWISEWCTGWYSYSASTEDHSSVPPRSIRSQKRVVDGSFPSRKVR